DLEHKEQELTELRERAASPDLWNDPDEARQVSQKLARYEDIFEEVAGLARRIEDAEVLLELAAEAGDDDSRQEALEQLSEISGVLDRLALESQYFRADDHADDTHNVHADADDVDAHE